MNEIFWPVPVDPSEHPEGVRIDVIGTLVATKEAVDRDGRPRLAGMFLCERNEGRFKLWGTVPGPIQSEIQNRIEREDEYGVTLRGSLVKFSAVVSRSPKDETFGFFMRPSKAEVIVPGYNGRER